MSQRIGRPQKSRVLPPWMGIRRFERSARIIQALFLGIEEFPTLSDCKTLGCAKRWREQFSAFSNEDSDTQTFKGANELGQEVLNKLLAAELTDENLWQLDRLGWTFETILNLLEHAIIYIHKSYWFSSEIAVEHSGVLDLKWELRQHPFVRAEMNPHPTFIENQMLSFTLQDTSDDFRRLSYLYRELADACGDSVHEPDITKLLGDVKFYQQLSTEIRFTQTREFFSDVFSESPLSTKFFSSCCWTAIYANSNESFGSIAESKGFSRQTIFDSISRVRSFGTSLPPIPQDLMRFQQDSQDAHFGRLITTLRALAFEILAVESSHQNGVRL